ncbi:MAG: hypothetical protein JWR19_4277 [Pedosphaera sp.]|nr:hypothetical protein [Pedosphaera sp.]
MVVAVVAMGMVQVAIDQVIDVIAMGHGFVATIGAVDMVFGMPANVMVAGAFIRMRGIHFHTVFFRFGAFLMHQMAVIEIIRVSVMFHRRVSATGAVLMIF